MQTKSSNTGAGSSLKLQQDINSNEDTLFLTDNKKKLVNDEKIINKKSADPFDKLIFEKGLRVKQIMADKKLDTMVILLNNAKALQVPIHYFPRLKGASQVELDQWELTGNGIGIRWKVLDEDISLKGLIKQSALTSMLHRLESKKTTEGLTVL